REPVRPELSGGVQLRRAGPGGLRWGPPEVLGSVRVIRQDESKAGVFLALLLDGGGLGGGGRSGLKQQAKVGADLGHRPIAFVHTTIPAFLHRGGRRRKKPPAVRSAVLGLTIALMATGGPAAAGRAVPQRIMSTNVCTDLLLLELAPKSRIASVTFLAPEAARALFPGAADGIPLNRNTAEDVVNVRPDLI